MAPGKKTTKGTTGKRPIEQYDHKGKTRVNNPPVGLVTPRTDPLATTHKSYFYDPHLDPQLQWAGKKEHLSFDVPTVSLHVHERIDPRTIIEAVRKRNGNGRPVQGYLFETKEENPPLRDAIDFYRHPHGWSNRLIAGDSLLVMNSLLEKEGMAGQVQMVYIDPPYGIRYGSNFQPFVNRRDVRDRKDEDLTQEPETIRAFRDTWELGIHSYLTYLRDRLLLVRELLHESGSCFVQISDQNLHLVRSLLDEIFGTENFVALIPFRKKTMPLGTVFLEQMSDFLLWYSKRKFGEVGKRVAKYRRLYLLRSVEGEFHHCWYELPDGSRQRMSKYQLYDHSLLPTGARVYRLKSLEPSGPMESGMFDFEFEGVVYKHPKNGYGTKPDGMDRLVEAKRIQAEGNRLTFIIYADESDASQLTAPWSDTVGADDKQYVVQTNTEVVKRCLLMTTDPGDIVFDPTCGSGTTAVVAEQWGRRWITCDTSRAATTLAKQRLMGATYDYYKLAHPEEGVGSGFDYKKAPHITLTSIANNEPPGEETLYDEPLVDNSKARVSGPFTVEAVPAPNVKSIDDLDAEPSKPKGGQEALSDFRHAATPLLDASIARSGPTIRQSDWRDELLKTGIRGKGGQMINFFRVEPLGGTRWPHADAETKGEKPERVVISFGPDYAPLETRQVESAWEEARTLHPKPEILVFAAFQFDPEAAKDIDELTKEKTGMTFLTAQMNADLLTDDLKKKRSSNQSFWLVGRPDVELRQIKSGDDKGKYQAEVRGFDYFNTRTGAIESGDTSKIAMWLLDIDYDGRSLYPRQVFFPLADEDEGWAKLARNLKAEIDPELIESYRGTVSLPFALGEHKRVAVKVIDDRGIESLKVISLA
jgi:adenine-specific DNA-methyltransferase